MRRVLTIMVALAMGACGGGVVVGGPVSTLPAPGTSTTVPSTSEESSTTTTLTGSDSTTTTVSAAPVKTSVVVYFMGGGGETPVREGPFLLPVHRSFDTTPAIARATLELLLAGPSTEEAAAGISSAIPAGTILLGVTIDDGVATVDLSREFEAGGGSFSMLSRLAQVVYTLTQFEAVDGVLFELDGEPVSVFGGEGILLEGPAARDQYTDLLPRILLESPAWGATISSPVRLIGLAAAFEATFQAEILDADGKVIAHPDYVMNTNDGIGFPWGGFDVTIGYEVDSEQTGAIRVWEYSAEDGSVLGERIYPVVLQP